MKYVRLRLVFPAAVAALAAGSVYAAFTAGSAPAAVEAHAAAKPTLITVTAGKPSELAFKVSKLSNIPAGTVTFKVTNQGLAFHNFEVCSAPVKTASATKNSCVGKKTPILKHGQSATLTVKFSKSGKYEFLCTVTGHAAAGMKGLLGIAVKVSPQPTPKPTPTPTPVGGTTTTTPATGGGGGGGATGGTPGNYDESDAACPPGKNIITQGGGDADGDEAGTEPNDNDGCV